MDIYERRAVELKRRADRAKRRFNLWLWICFVFAALQLTAAIVVWWPEIAKLISP